jgi:hypothetical protein
MGAVMAGLQRMWRIASRARLSSSSGSGPLGAPPPLKSDPLANGLMPIAAPAVVHGLVVIQGLLGLRLRPDDDRPAHGRFLMRFSTTAQGAPLPGVRR